MNSKGCKNQFSKCKIFDLIQNLVSTETHFSLNEIIKFSQK